MLQKQEPRIDTKKIPAMKALKEICGKATRDWYYETFLK
uniref:Uncharacterized protein n=1 Tax=Nelumbo nucifera TaxID=4432 RepID=A0A822YG12_NELNU|nr:TPA_asm: hypothetical protein HUJ06_010278 [Nelumbo nucifera]